MRNLPSRASRFALAFMVVGALTSCIDEQIVYEDKDAFADPPSAAGSFIGYSDRDAKQTICGSCHVEKQGDWVETAHAGAWATLQDSGHAQEFCSGCHSVNALGNATTADAGYVSTGDERYEDVQCESCHGPGLDHASAPTAENAPLAPMFVGENMTTGCGACHEGSHHPFVEEWAQSSHGTVNALAAGADGTCAVCHTGEGALQAWGVDARYVEQAQVFEPGQHMAITCAVCHDPHGGPNHAQLRFPIDVPSEEQHLCMKCHNRRGKPDPRSIFGPHAPAGPTLLGDAGWWPPSLEWQGGTILGTHGTPEANPKLCAQCHVFPFEVTDAATGGFAFQATGHLFAPTPCLDSEGKPTVDDDCDDSERSFASCTGSGCHANVGLARQAKSVADRRIEELTAELAVLVEQVPISEFNSADNRYTAGEGSKFNVELASYPGSAIHNPFLMEALLLASIAEVERVYGLTASPGLSLAPAFEQN